MKIAVTGATGFFGSSLCARFLNEGHRVLALSRNDADGTRTRKAVAEAAAAFGHPPLAAGWSRLEVKSIDFDAIESSLDSETLADIEIMWHAAAEMSYAGKRLEQSFQQNVSASSQLYRHCVRHAALCRRFYYVSTAYTAGFDQREVPEVIHCAPRLVNVYQASKWASELNLAWQNQAASLPLCIFRPAIIIGQEQSAWYGGKEFGMYSIARGLYEAAERGAKRLHLAIDGSAFNNLVSIDRVIDLAFFLSLRQGAGDHCEIFHAVADGGLTLSECLDVAGDLLGLKVVYAQPRTAFDQHFMRAIHLNRQFAGTHWDFATEKLREAMGEAYRPYALSPETLRRMLAAYFDDLHARPKAREAESFRTRPLPRFMIAYMMQLNQTLIGFRKRLVDRI